MGRTYKRNDLHNSRRPKSIREKRQQGGRYKGGLSDTYEEDFSTSKQQRNTTNKQQSWEDYE